MLCTKIFQRTTTTSELAGDGCSMYFPQHSERSVALYVGTVYLFVDGCRWKKGGGGGGSRGQGPVSKRSGWLNNI